MPAPAFAIALSLLIGALAVSALERLPMAWCVIALTGIAGVAAGLAGTMRRPVLIVTLGGLLLWLEARLLLDDRLDVTQVGVDIETVLRIVDFPTVDGVTRFVAAPVSPAMLPERLRLSWYDATAVLSLDDCWRMTLRLRRPRGFSNPGRFDYEAWLMSRRIGATGYVRHAEPSQDCGPPSGLARIRRSIAERIRSGLPADDATAVLLAVTLGARHWISDAQWQAFAITGTSHLMAISGMHVALAFGAFFLLARFALGAAGFRVSQRSVAAGAALLFAGAYAAVSGFAVPARRALAMLFLAVLVTLGRRPASTWQIFGLAAISVVALAPLDVLTPGFKLSFGAVALLLVLAARRSPGGPDRSPVGQRVRRAARELGALQMTLIFGLLPLTLGLFGRLSWLSPLANFAVLPLFNLVTLPAALAGSVAPAPLSDFLLLVAWRSTTLILDTINAIASLPFADTSLPVLGPYGVIAAILAAVATLLPAGWPCRSLRYVAVVVLLANHPQRPPEDCVDIDVLDVGQGLAVVARTRRAVMVYDTGPAFRSGGDTGRLVVVPFLRYSGIDDVDWLVVSHADLDHAGGRRSLLGAIGVGVVLAGEPEDGPGTAGAPTPERRCEAGQAWQRDGIHFTVIHPPRVGRRRGNNASCVIEIRAGRYRALLTGDIEAVVERALLRDGLLDRVNLLVVPHHGSKTSSHAAFVRALSPEVAINSAGYQNRWGMPRPEVVDRFNASGALFLNTADSGAIGYRLCASDGLTLRYRNREDARRFWHDD